MSHDDKTQPKESDSAALKALRRAAYEARRIAVQTNTGIAVIENGQLIIKTAKIILEENPELRPEYK